MSSISVEEYRKQFGGGRKTVVKRNKFNATKIEKDGMKFGSVKEYKRYIELTAQMQRGEKTHAISRWSALCKERDDLQARIDGALEKCYTGIRKQGGDYYLELVQDILKGNKDEN